MANGPRSMTVWCRVHRWNVTAEPDGTLRHAPAGDLCGGTEFFMTTERMIDRDTAAAELARFSLPGVGQVYAGTVRISSTRDDFAEVETAVIPAGVLQVTSYFRAVKDDGMGHAAVVGWECSKREARLDGDLVTDPLRAQALADEAGFMPPGAFTDTPFT